MKAALQLDDYFAHSIEGLLVVESNSPLDVTISAAFYSIVRPFGDRKNEVVRRAIICSQFVKAKAGRSIISIKLPIPHLLCSNCYFENNIVNNDTNPLFLRNISAHNHEVPPQFSLQGEKDLKAETRHYVEAEYGSETVRQHVQLLPWSATQGERQTINKRGSYNVEIKHPKCCAAGDLVSFGIEVELKREQVVHCIDLNLVSYLVLRGQETEKITERMLLRSSGQLDIPTLASSFGNRLEDIVMPCKETSFIIKTIERYYAVELVLHLSHNEKRGKNTTLSEIRYQ